LPNPISVEYRALAALIPYARNSRTHDENQVAQIAASIKEFGWTNPVLVDGDNGIIAGHGRILAARKLGYAEVPVIELAGLTDAQKRAYIIADNKLALNAGWDDDLLRVELEGLDAEDFDLRIIGFSSEELSALMGEDESEDREQGSAEAGGAGSLSGRFLIPPFSVLNAREGWWQTRKRGWLALGIKSELGRGENGFHAAPGGSPMVSGYDANGKRLTGLKKAGKADASAYGTAAWMKEKGLAGGAQDLAHGTGTSIFDPVLCEIAYRWFSPAGGIVLDPFAGGSVRGVVAAKLDRQYIGHELRDEQVIANRAQADEICAECEHPPAWIIGDSRNIDKTCADVTADFLFSCPPYADLEVYSDDPLDLSTLGYADFKAAYFEIIAKACARLANNRFACFVVGEVRDKKGNYYDFVGDTVEAFRAAGLAYYNEIILVTAVGSLPIRAGKQFSSGRKIGKTHQNVLVFVKGDGKKAAEACGIVEVDESMFDSISVDEG
jgi:ParB-like chromosome segregation protein Spo0J